MGNIVDINGNPYEDVAAKEKAETAIKEKIAFHVPSVVGQAERYIHQKGLGFFSVFISPDKKEIKVSTNLSGPNVDKVLIETIQRHYGIQSPL